MQTDTEDLPIETEIKRVSNRIVQTKTEELLVEIKGVCPAGLYRKTPGQFDQNKTVSRHPKVVHPDRHDRSQKSIGSTLLNGWKRGIGLIERRMILFQALGVQYFSSVKDRLDRRGYNFYTDRVRFRTNANGRRRRKFLLLRPVSEMPNDLRRTTALITTN